jgi:hypothetical protein
MAGGNPAARAQGRSRVLKLADRDAERTVLEPHNLELARETYLDAWTAAFTAGHLATDDMAEICRAVRGLPRTPDPGPVELLLDGLTLLIRDRLPAAAAALRQVVSLFAGDEVAAADRLRWSFLAFFPAVLLWDNERCRAMLDRQVQSVRDAGALDRLPLDLGQVAIMAAWRGDFEAAASLGVESEAICKVTGAQHPTYISLQLGGLRGDQAKAVPLFDATIRAAEARGHRSVVTYTRWATAILYNGLGHYDQAREAARQAAEDPTGLFVAMWALPELIEAAARSGNQQLADDALKQLADTTQVGGTDFGLGIEARSRALVTEGQTADDLYREAIDRLGRTWLRPELARAHLLYGEWLRRENRRADAREQLRTAHGMFDEIGMEAFAERARRELLATGETARKRAVQAPVAASQELTAQEMQVARLARDGLSNPEIGARLFISSHNGAVPPEQGLRQARHHLPRSAPPGPARRHGSTRPLTSTTACYDNAWSSISFPPRTAAARSAYRATPAHHLGWFDAWQRRPGSQSGKNRSVSAPRCYSARYQLVVLTR